MTHAITVGCAAVALALTITGTAFARHPHVPVPAGKALRLQFPANYTVPPHSHRMTERVTVVSGALYAGIGDTLDRQRSQAHETRTR
jgi:hypothetical protein